MSKGDPNQTGLKLTQASSESFDASHHKASSETAPHAASHGSITYSEGSAIRPLPHT